MSKKEENPAQYKPVSELLDYARAKAMELTIQRIEEGKASDGLLQLLLKGLLPESQVEQRVKEQSLELMGAKIEKLHSEVTSEEQFQSAMVAFSTYSASFKKEDDNIE